jgi:hypothetical protein
MWLKGPVAATWSRGLVSASPHSSVSGWSALGVPCRTISLPCRRAQGYVLFQVPVRAAPRIGRSFIHYINKCAHRQHIPNGRWFAIRDCQEIIPIRLTKARRRPWQGPVSSVTSTSSDHESHSSHSYWSHSTETELFAPFLAHKVFLLQDLNPYRSSPPFSPAAPLPPYTKTACTSKRGKLLKAHFGASPSFICHRGDMYVLVNFPLRRLLFMLYGDC